MSKKPEQESPEEQIERFKRVLRDMVEAGELCPSKAEKWFGRSLADPGKPPKGEGVE